jgi:hypothetical protein
VSIALFWGVGLAALGWLAFERRIYVKERGAPDGRFPAPTFMFVDRALQQTRLWCAVWDGSPA